MESSTTEKQIGPKNVSGFGELLEMLFHEKCCTIWWCQGSLGVERWIDSAVTLLQFISTCASRGWSWKKKIYSCNFFIFCKWTLVTKVHIHHVWDNSLYHGTTHTWYVQLITSMEIQTGQSKPTGMFLEEGGNQRTKGDPYGHYESPHGQ